MLDHPNLIRVFEFGLLPGGQPFFLMEIVDGPTLADEIKKLGSLDLERALKIFINVAFAIQYAHDHKVVHRDLKPSNIMLAKPLYAHEQEIVKVVDFGIAKLTGVDEFNQQTLTKTGEIFGSPFYMSPEQCMGIAVDHRSDLYSLGCVFYETLTGAPPFIGDSALSTMMKHQSDSHLSLKEASLGRQFSEDMENIISKLLEKDPDNRYQNANALAEDLIALEKSMKGEETAAVKATLSSAAHKLEKEKKKISSGSNTYVMISVIACAFVCGLAMCYFILKLQSSAPAARVKMLPQSFPLDDYGSNSMQKSSNQPASPSSAQTTIQPWSTKTGQYLEFHFPENDSLGQIEFKNGSQKKARGVVQVPLGQPFGLSVSSHLVQNPQLLDGFRPDEISVLDLVGSKRVNPDFYSHMKRLTGLQILNLSGTDFGNSELDSLDGMTKLRYLNLATTRVSCRSLLQSPILKQLNCLDVTGLYDGDVLGQEISTFANLRQLMMAGSEVKTEDLRNLAKSKSIKILCLAQNYIVDSDLANLLPLKTLEWIDLSRTKVTPECGKYLAQMPNLKTVEIGQMFHGDASKSSFIGYMRQRKPGVKLIMTDVATGDLASAMPEFPWAGNGTISHIDLNLAKFITLPHQDPDAK
jgi:serine/threonine protein kinase